MKKKLLYILSISMLAVGTPSCSDFGNMNLNPESTAPTEMDFKMVFTNVQQYCYGTEYEAWRNGLIYISTMIQHTSSIKSRWNGDKYTYNAGYNSAYWDRMYPNGVRDVVTVMNEWKDKEEYYTEYQMLRVLRVLLLHRMTDMYGDVPYAEAGLGYISQLGYPKYDSQETIYKDMLKELKEAASNMNGKTSKIGDADIIYKGDVQKWQKLSYSLMLRLGMRLSKIDSELAKEWTKTAVAGGLIADNSDNAKIEHPGASTSNNTCEPFGKIYCYEDPGAYRMSESFVDLLKNTNDPRLVYLCTVVTDPNEKIGGTKWEMGDTTAVNQIGMPNGYDLTSTGETNIKNYSKFPGDINKYSVANRYTYARIDAPTFLVTNAENLLLLAEAAHRGWISGTAEDYYNRGVIAAMKQFSQFGIDGISDAQIQAYLTLNPFDASKALEQINVQYYINTFSDEYESYANWRRSGYPVLKEVNYVGNVTNGTIPRRFTYPTSEATFNRVNYNEAVARLSGGDKMTSRVWWDKQ